MHRDPNCVKLPALAPEFCEQSRRKQPEPGRCRTTVREQFEFVPGNGTNARHGAQVRRHAGGIKFLQFAQLPGPIPERGKGGVIGDNALHPARDHGLFKML